MAIIWSDLPQTLVENTSMQVGTENGVAKMYRITPNTGYVLHDKRYDTYADYDDEGNGIGDVILGYRTSTASISVAHFNANTYEFYAVLATEVPENQIFDKTITPEVM